MPWLTDTRRMGLRACADDTRSAFRGVMAQVSASVSSSVLSLVAAHDPRALERGFRLIEAFNGPALLETLQEKAEGALAAADPALGSACADTLSRMTQS